MSFRVVRGGLVKKERVPLQVGQCVTLIRVPNEPCTALRPEHVGKLKGEVIRSEGVDDLDRPLWRVRFSIGDVFVLEDMVK